MNHWTVYQNILHISCRYTATNVYAHKNRTYPHAQAHTQSQMAVSAVTLEASRWSIWKSGRVLYHWLCSGHVKLAVCQWMEEGNWFFKGQNKNLTIEFVYTKRNPCTYTRPEISIHRAGPNMLHNLKEMQPNLRSSLIQFHSRLVFQIAPPFSLKSRAVQSVSCLVLISVGGAEQSNKHKAISLMSSSHILTVFIFFSEVLTELGKHKQWQKQNNFI